MTQDAAVHPALAAFLGDGPAPDTPLETLRAASDETGLRTAGDPVPGVTEEALRIPVQGGEIGALVFRGTPLPGRGVPVIAYFHGGGWATGSPAGFAAIARNLARFSGGVVVSVDYRLAPEHRFPVPANDCIAATRWLQANAAAVGGATAPGEDAPTLVLAGDSAGAHLALTVGITLRDAGRDADGILAFYPCLDPGCDTPSWKRLGTGHFLTRERMLWYWRALLGDAGARKPTAAMSPWLGHDLEGLPPTWIMTAGLDPLRDEGQAFAMDLRDAGVDVGTQDRPGMLHGFLRWRSLVGDEADGAVQDACDWLFGQDDDE